MSTSVAPVTRRVARVVLTTIKKIGGTRGATLKKIHEYIKRAYPCTPHNIVKINNTLQKALALGAIKKKKNKYILANVIKDIVDGQGFCQAYILKSRRRFRRRGRRRGRKRGRRRGRRGRRHSRRRALKTR